MTYEPYRPLDDTLGRWPVRVLRHFDRCSFAEIALALDAAPGSDRNALSVTLRRLAIDGLVRRRLERHADVFLDGGYSYAVTDRGRAWLRRKLEASTRASEPRP